jgi:hypothetical protein
MKASELLTQLQLYQEIGIDLDKADVVVEYTEYDESIDFDIGRVAQTYPEGICIRNGDIIIGGDE